MVTGETQKKVRWVRMPQQVRSDRSLRRILDAAEKIMERKNFSEITVAEIVKKARSSVGVFYSRFPDKLALLHHLDERFAEEAERAIERHLRYPDWKGCSLAVAGGEVIEFLCRSHYEKKGMLKSIILEVRTHPNRRFQHTGKRLVNVIDRMAGFLLNWRGEMTDPYPERTLRLALIMAISTIRDFLVFSETTLYQDLIGIDLADFQASLKDAFLRIVSTRSHQGNT